MENNLKISLIQTHTVWENKEENLINLTAKIQSIQESVDIIVLSELFSTGFTMNAKNVAETMEGKSVNWMRNTSKDKQSLVIGSLLIKEQEYYYNRLIVAFPSGELQYYDKRHLFSFAGEEKVFTAGTERLVFNYKGFNICPLICYDLRFPVWARNTASIDVLIFVANWPKERIFAWDALLKARAIENLCYVVAVNRIGKDNNELNYSGHSKVINALGDTILRCKDMEEDIKSTNLDKNYILKIREKYQFLEDGDSYTFTK